MAANYDELVPALSAFAAFAAEHGATRDATNLRTLLDRLEREKRSNKSLEEEIFKHRRLTAATVLPRFARAEPAESERLTAEFARLRAAVDVALNPPKPDAVPTTHVKGLAGNAEDTKVYGNPEQAQAIARQAIDVVHCFSAAVFQREFDSAHDLCTAGYGAGRSMKRMITDLRKADEAYGGPAVACEIEQINHLWADDDARRRMPKAAGGWPKETPPLSQRAIVVAFWFTDRKTRAGRWAAFWVVEAPHGYRIAKWSQYLQ